MEQPAVRLFAELGWETVSASEEVFGHGATLQRETKGRALARAQRRIGRAGSQISGTLSVPFIQLLEDPVPRKSQDSYLIQLVDLCAYAAFRSVYPPPRTTVIEQGTWDELGDARLLAVSSRTTNGLVIWP